MKNASERSGRGSDESRRAKHAILIVGAGGMLGTALLRAATRRGDSVTAYTRDLLDITDPLAVRRTVGAFAASVAQAETGGVVINAAAYTDVERAEDNREAAYLVNAFGADWLAGAANDEGLSFVHMSTDYVFDGSKGAAYVETDDTRPLNVYGASKLAGEQAVLSSHPNALIVRTAWTYGPGGANFPLKILERAAGLKRQTPELEVVEDEVGSPTYSVDLAEGLLSLMAADAAGVYHLAGSGSCSRYELALITLRLAGCEIPRDLSVIPVTSAGFPRRAARPPASVLDCSKAAALGALLPAWQDGLSRFIKSIPIRLDRATK